MRQLRIRFHSRVGYGRLARVLAMFALASVLLAGVGCASTSSQSVAPAQKAVSARMAAEDAWHYTGEAPQVTTATPIGVLSGDRAVFMTPEGELEVRMVGIQAPQSKTVKDIYEVESFNATKGILSKTPVVYLELGAQSKDAYGTTLAYVWLKRPSESPTAEEVRADMLNARLLEAGLVRRRAVAPGMASLNTKYSPIFNAYQAEAKATQQGLWSPALAANGEDDSTWSVTQVSSTANATNTPFVGNSATYYFHRSNCPNAIKMSPAHRVPFQSAGQALVAGFRPCGICRP